MNYFQLRLYLARGISSFGDWMTFLAIALFVSEKFGSHAVPFSFLCSSLPPLLLSQYTHQIIPARYQRRFYMAGLIAQSINVGLMIFATQLWQVYLYLIFSGCIGAFSRPIFDSIIGCDVPEHLRRTIYTRIGALTSSLLCISPAIGVAISSYYGYHTVFLIDACTFLIALILLLPNLVDHVSPPRSHADQDPAAFNSARRRYLPKEFELEPRLQNPLLQWYVFLITGAMINALEFSFFEYFDFTKSQIGTIVGAWGVGSLGALLTPKDILERITVIPMLIVYGLSFLFFGLNLGFMVSLALFGCSGFASSVLGGLFRSNIQKEITSTMPSSAVWGLVNSRLSVLNIVVYGSLGVLLKDVSPNAFLVPFAGSVVLCIYLIWRGRVR